MTDNQTATFGALLRSLRLASGLSQEMLAERAGLSAAAIAALERGRRTTPRADTVTLLASALALTDADRSTFISTALGNAEPAPARLSASNLPVQLTSFIGREEERTQVRLLLRTARLVTLTGTGGAGKTRLALRIAEELLGEYPDGVWLVELAPLTEAALAPQAVAQVLGVREERGRPLAAALVDHLRDARALLVLDNCEHLIAACADLVAALLRGCPSLRLLATSREPLNLNGEQCYRVPSLPVPDLDHLPPPERLGDYPSMLLFLARAREQRPEFALNPRNLRAVAQVCARLDGIPLAIELAAARITTLPVEAIAARLDDCFRLLTGGPRTVMPRQQTLRAALDWSYDLLSEQEQVALRRLAVFVGGWTLEAAEAICAGSYLESWEVLDLLGALVNKSLVLVEEREEEARFRLLETVRQYEHEKLVSAGEAPDLAERHLDWYLDQAVKAEAFLVGPEQRSWLSRLEIDHDNLRAALRLTLTEAQPNDPAAAAAGGKLVRGLTLAAALWRFWYMRGHLTEGRRWLEDLLRLTESSNAAGPVRARALHGAGVLAVSQGDYETARRLCEQSLAFYQTLDDSHGAAVALNILGHVAEKQGDFARAITLSQESLALHRAHGSTRDIAVALNNLATVLLSQGDHGHAQALYEECLVLNRELGDSRGTAITLTNLGEAARCRADYDRAAAYCEQSLALSRELGDAWGVAAALNTLADIARDNGRSEEAVQLYEQCLALRRELGDNAGVATLRDALATLRTDQGNHQRE
ncbi:MAG TPA: tetratricopeptide repeat protein [Chloroflexota bacterium]|nr:tetratricopeptide repeat protein [Chloroflexota bacterium]